MKRPSQSEKTLFIALCPKCHVEKPTVQDVVHCPVCNTLIANFQLPNGCYPRTSQGVGTLTIDWHPSMEAKYRRTVYLGIAPGRAAAIVKVQMYRFVPVQFTYEAFSPDIIKARELKDK